MNRARVRCQQAEHQSQEGRLAAAGGADQNRGAAIRDQDGIRYMNCGDWVESCTALVEHEDGSFEILTWTDPLKQAAPVPQLTARAA